MDNTKILAEFISNTKDIPEKALEAGRRLILDSVGCGLGALRTEQADVVRRFADMQGTGNEVIMGTGIKASPVTAAYANGRLINIIDMDETYLVMGHHANATLGAILALADTCQLTGEQVLKAFTVAYEIGTRAGNYMGNQMRIDDEGRYAGWNFPGPILDAFASCAAACICFGLNPEQVENALGICAMYLPSNSGGIWEEGRSRSKLPNIKYEDCGYNTQAGIMAAFMAKEGITGTLGVFDPDVSLAQVASAMCTPNYARLTYKLGEDWRITRTSFKTWPSCRWFHYAETALDKAIAGRDIDPDKVEKVEVLSASSCVLNKSPEIGKNIVMDASFSVPHCVAMQLMGIPAGPAWFEKDTVFAETTEKLKQKVEVKLNPELEMAEAWGPVEKWGEADGPLKVPSKVKVYYDGQVLEGETTYAYGDCWEEDCRLSDQQLKDKFIRLMASARPGDVDWEEKAGLMAERLLAIDKEPSASALLKDLNAD